MLDAGKPVACCMHHPKPRARSQGISQTEQRIRRVVPWKRRVVVLKFGQRRGSDGSRVDHSAGAASKTGQDLVGGAWSRAPRMHAPRPASIRRSLHRRVRIAPVSAKDVRTPYVRRNPAQPGACIRQAMAQRAPRTSDREIRCLCHARWSGPPQRCLLQQRFDETLSDVAPQP
jgi:hypothetical protein